MDVKMEGAMRHPSSDRAQMVTTPDTSVGNGGGTTMTSPYRSLPLSTSSHIRQSSPIMANLQNKPFGHMFDSMSNSTLGHNNNVSSSQVTNQFNMNYQQSSLLGHLGDQFNGSNNGRLPSISHLSRLNNHNSYPNFAPYSNPPNSGQNGFQSLLNYGNQNTSNTSHFGGNNMASRAVPEPVSQAPPPTQQTRTEMSFPVNTITEAEIDQLIAQHSSDFNSSYNPNVSSSYSTSSYQAPVTASAKPAENVSTSSDLSALQQYPLDNMEMMMQMYHPDVCCLICRRVFATSSDLNEHLKTHIEDLAACQSAGKQIKAEKSDDLSSVSAHVAEAEKVPPGVSDQTKTLVSEYSNRGQPPDYPRSTNLATPVNSQSPAVTNTSPVNANVRRASDQGQSTPSSYGCYICHQSFPSMQDLNLHMDSAHAAAISQHSSPLNSGAESVAAKTGPAASRIAQMVASHMDGQSNRAGVQLHQMTTHADQMNRMQGQMNTQSGQMNNVPSQLNAQSNQMNNVPGQMNLHSGQINTPHGHMNTQQGHMNMPLSQMNYQPGHRNVQMEQVSMQSGNMHGQSDHLNIPANVQAVGNQHMAFQQSSNHQGFVSDGYSQNLTSLDEPTGPPAKKPKKPPVKRTPVPKDVPAVKKKWPCPECGKVLSRADKLKCHMKSQHQDVKHGCPFCDKVFTTHERLNEHKRKHTGEKPFICTVCSKGFAQAGHLRRHMKTHPDIVADHVIDANRRVQTPEMQFSPKVHTPDHPFPTPPPLTRNVSTPDSPFASQHLTHKVPTPDNQFSSQLTGGVHTSDNQFLQPLTRAVHTPESPFQTQHPGQNVQSSEDQYPQFQSSTNVNNSQYSLAAGGMAASGNGGLDDIKPDIDKESISTVLDDIEATLAEETMLKPLKCEFCGERYVDYTGLGQHDCIQSKEGQRLCTVCGQSFVSEMAYSAHAQAHHLKCEDCEEVCATPTKLAEHRMTHGIEKPFVCETCGKTFKRPLDVERHQLVHSTEKPFQCDVCYTRFKRNDKLKIHMRLHTGEMPYECTMCDRKFRRKDHLNKHVKKHEKDSEGQESNDSMLRQSGESEGEDRSHDELLRRSYEREMVGVESSVQEDLDLVRRKYEEALREQELRKNMSLF